jgi:hypothetical protein
VCYDETSNNLYTSQPGKFVACATQYYFVHKPCLLISQRLNSRYHVLHPKFAHAGHISVRRCIYNEAIQTSKMHFHVMFLTTIVQPQPNTFITLYHLQRVASIAAFNGMTRRLLPRCKPAFWIVVGVNSSLHVRKTLFMSRGTPSTTTVDTGTNGRSSILAAKMPYSCTKVRA